ncbi:MAG: hypothetical protein JXD22_02725 [Sedimentisphaerales bacterium]|nr:hypothetical protein [Sedimentisphaerales bacterium]
MARPRTYNYVNFICRRIVKDEAISEDLTQDSFVKAIENINTFNANDPNSSFKSFIRVIAYRIRNSRAS